MADNVTANSSDSGGATFATALASWSGDSAHIAGCFLLGVSGTEGAYTVGAINGDATNGLEVDVTRVQGTVTVDLGANNDVTLATLPDTAAGDLAAINALLATIDADTSNITACNTGAVVVSSGTVTETNSTDILADTAAMVVDLAAIEVLQTTIAGDTTSIDGKITACNTGAVVVSSGTITAVTDITNTVTVDGTVTANLSATDNAVLDAIAASVAGTATIQDGGNSITVDTGASLASLISTSQDNTDGAEAAATNFDAGGAGVHNYITSVTICNSHASTNGTVALRDGSAGTVIWQFPAPAGGGATHNFNPPLRQPTANTALYFDPSAAISTISVSISGFQA